MLVPADLQDEALQARDVRHGGAGRACGGDIGGDEDPLRRFAQGAAQHIVKADGGYEVILNLPLVEKGSVDSSKKGRSFFLVRVAAWGGTSCCRTRWRGCVSWACKERVRDLIENDEAPTFNGSNRPLNEKLGPSPAGVRGLCVGAHQHHHRQNGQNHQHSQHGRSPKLRLEQPRLDIHYTLLSGDPFFESSS